jgi:CheY-like chemotaxis protein
MDALAALDAGEDADLIVCDLSMPAMDGITLIREAHRRRPKLPAILLTGFATNAAEIAVGGAVSGLFTLLRKPITEQHLVERVAVLGLCG